MVDIFIIENEKVVLNPNCLLIPWLKVIKVDYPEDYMNVYTYIHYMTAITKNPYDNLAEDDKKIRLRDEYDGDYNATDKVVCDAINNIKSLIIDNDTTIRYWMANKTMVNKLSVYLETAIVDDSKETGNLTHIRGLVKDCGKTIEEFRKLESAKDATLKSRGDKTLGYDM